MNSRLRERPRFGIELVMLTGKRLFTGDTVTEVIATVIKEAPDPDVRTFVGDAAPGALCAGLQPA